MDSPDNQGSAPDNEIALLIDGRAHAYWSTYSIDSDLLIPADAWHVTLTQPLGETSNRVAAGAHVEVRVGRDTVLMGYVDDVQRKTSRHEKTLMLHGRDYAAILRDCSAPIFTAKQVTLAEVASSIVKPLGIKRVKISAKQSGHTWDKITVEPGDTAWDALKHAAEGEGLWPWFEPDGTLVIGGPDYNAPPVATLILRENGQGNNVEWFEESRSVAERHSEVTVLGQAHGTHSEPGKHAIKVTIKDQSVPVYRPKIYVDHDAPNLAAAEARAKKIISDSALAAHTLRASVQGHRTSNGVLWKPGQRVHVIWDEWGIDAIYFLMGRRFTGGRPGGEHTLLKLKEDRVWIPEAHPHSGRKHRHGGPSYKVTDATINATITANHGK